MVSPNKLNASAMLIGLVAITRIAKIALGMGSGGGLADLAFSASDAPNGPGTLPTAGGSAGSGSGPASPPDDDSWVPEGFDGPLDFFDWVSWSALKGFLPKAVGPPLDLLEAGPAIGETLIEVRNRNQRHDELFTTDFRGDSHLQGDGQ
jgi:hypothetical protein